MGFTGENEKKEEIQEEDEEETDIYDLFSHYNSLYFDDALGSCLLSWSSHRQMNSCTGDCLYDRRGGCEILLSEPLLKLGSTIHIKNALLHEMIHAFLWIKHKNMDHSDHGSRFQEVRNSIYSISIIDAQRPHCGYNINLHHEFKKDVTEHELKKEIKTYKFYHWTCDTCGDLIKKSREPSDRDCIDKAGPAKSCGNLSCHWHNHKNACPGSYVITESPKCKEKQASLKVEQAREHEHGTFKELPNKARQSTGGESETEATIRKKEVKTDWKGEQELQLMPHMARRATRNSCPNERSNEKSHGKKAMRTAACLQPAEESHGRANGRRSVMCKQRYTGKKRGGYRNGENKDTFRGDWLCMYGDEEEDETVEPLINKRTERRKRLKLLLQTAGNAAETEDARNESEPLINKGTEMGKRRKLLLTADEDTTETEGA